MIKASYEQIIEKISQISGIPVEELKRRVEAKREKLSGLISLEGAAQIVASELGISFENQQFKIAQLLIGMKKINVLGKVIKIDPIRKYRRAGKEGEIATFTLADETASIRVVLWDIKLIELVKNGTIKENSVVFIKGADVRGTTAKELHLASNSEIELSNEKMEKVITKEILPLRKIVELKPNDKVAVRGYVVQAFKPALFQVCPECGLKISYESGKAFCPRHETVIPKNRLLFTLILDDGSGTIRVLFPHETALKLLKLENEETINDLWLEKKQELLGLLLEVRGRVRKNAVFDRLEIVAEDFSEIKPEKIIEELSEQ